MSIKFSTDFKAGGKDLLIRCCDGIEGFYKYLDVTKFDTAELSIEAIYDVNQSKEHPYQYVGNFFKFIHASYIEKYRELIGDFISSINSKHYLTAALCGRSLIESTATLRYYNNAVMKKVRISSKKEIEGIDIEFLHDVLSLASKHMHGSNMNWADFFTTDKKTFIRELVDKEKRRLKKEPPKKEDFIKSYPIGKFLDSWFDDDPELVALAYNFYSEIVHPNLGSNLLLIGILNGKVQVGRDSNRAAGKSICKEAVTFLAPCLKEAANQLAQSTLISSLGNQVDPPHKTLH